MQAKLLDREQIKAWVDRLLGHYRVTAPVMRDGIMIFDWLETAGDLQLPRGAITKVSAKHALLSRTEVLFYYRTKSGRATTAPPPPPQPQVIFGIHPCDVQAVKVLDAVFRAPPYPDTLYLARREVTTLVGLGALPSEVPNHCFFESLGISAMDNRDCDLFLAPLGGDKYVLELLTEKGAAIAASLPSSAEPDPGELNTLKQLRAEAAARVNNCFASPEFHAAVARFFDSPLWDNLAETCIACAACTYLCPTCHCFDIQDETHGDLGCRVRNWDTCQFDIFTLHASGHNPRPAQKQRARQRIFHKFDYGLKNFGLPFCVGCGRCALACPLHNNLLTILRKIAAEKSQETKP